MDITWFDYQQKIYLLLKMIQFTLLHIFLKNPWQNIFYYLIIYFNFVIFLIDFGLSSFEYRVERKLSIINKYIFFLNIWHRQIYNLFLGMGNKSNEHNTHHVVKFDHLKQYWLEIKMPVTADYFQDPQMVDEAGGDLYLSHQRVLLCENHEVCLFCWYHELQALFEHQIHQ